MREEIAAAVVFLKRLMQKCESIPSQKLEEFTRNLSSILVDRFRDHWYKEKPDRGQGYRCITFSPVEPIDPVLEKAASESGVNLQEPLLPIEMTLWVDPNEVCCRIGDMRTSYCQVAAMKDGSLDNKAHTLDISDFIQRAKELYNKQLNITTTRVNSNHNRKMHDHARRCNTPDKSSSPIDNHNFNHNFYTNATSNGNDKNFENGLNNNNRKFVNQNNRRQFNNFNGRQPFGPLDNVNGPPFIPPDFSVPPPPPPPMGFKPWQSQPPGAYSPPAKNKNLNSNFRNKTFSYKNTPPPPLGPVPNGDRFHWQKDSQKVGS